MPSFDTNVLNVYLISVFSLAVIAVIFSIALAATEVVRHHRLRPNGSGTGQVRPAPHRGRDHPFVDQGRVGHG